MEDLKTRLQLESNRREIFERKNAELEALNDNLRLENDVRGFARRVVVVPQCCVASKIEVRSCV